MIDLRSTKAYKLEKENRYLKKEMERLNNIINELEKELKFQRKISLSLNESFAVSIIDILINKLQELKGINEPTFEEMVNFVENVCKDIKSQSTLDEELEEERERIAKIVDDFKGVDKE